MNIDICSRKQHRILVYTLGCIIGCWAAIEDKYKIAMVLKNACNLGSAGFSPSHALNSLARQPISGEYLWMVIAILKHCLRSVQCAHCLYQRHPKISDSLHKLDCFGAYINDFSLLGCLALSLVQDSGYSSIVVLHYAPLVFRRCSKDRLRLRWLLH
jgi:hypothetical protein